MSTPRTKAEIDAELSRLDIPDTAIVKLLVLGNSGRGKSFLLDALLSMPLFEHRMSATSVTSANDFALYVDPRQVAWVLCNAPGLIEADAALIQRNQSCVEGVIQLKPNSSTVAVFVFGHTGGRPLDEDVRAFRAVKQYVPTLPDASIAFIVNPVEREEFGTDAEYNQWLATISRLIREATGTTTAARVFVTPKVAVRDRGDFTSAAMRSLSATVYNIVQILQPANVVPAPEARLLLDRNKMKEELAAIQKTLVENQAAFQKQIAELTAEWQRRIEEQRRESDARNAELQRTLIELANRPPPAPIIIQQPPKDDDDDDGFCCVS